MKMKRLLISVLAIVMLLSMVACGNPSDQSPDQNSDVNSGSQTTATPAVPFDPVSGETIDAGNISALCPEGWFNSPVVDMFAAEAGALDTSKLLFLKGTDDSWSNSPCASISYYGESGLALSFAEQLDFYDGAALIDPFMIGDTVWEGLSYDLGDDVTEVIIGIQGVSAFNVLLRIKGEGQTISFADADVQTILSSITY